jgi:hypothetical protein
VVDRAEKHVAVLDAASVYLSGGSKVVDLAAAITPE